MARNQVLFIVSGLVSLLFLVIILSGSIFMMLELNNKKIYALKKDTYISISINTPVVETKKKQLDKPKEKIKKVEKKIVETVSESKEVNIDNLFDNVWTKKVDIKKTTPKKVNNRRIAEIQKKIKTKSNSKNSSTNNKKEIVNETVDNRLSTADEVNEYLAKIQAIVYKYFYPPDNSQGNSVKAVIKISSLGKVIDFRILNYSQNENLNKECDNIKNRLISVVFPINPDNKTKSYIIILKSEE